MTVRIDRELMPVIDEYLERRRGDGAEIRAMLADMDMAGIGLRAHQLQGSGGSFGFDRISDVGHSLAEAVLRADEQGITAAVEGLESFLACVEVEYV